MTITQNLWGPFSLKRRLFEEEVKKDYDEILKEIKKYEEKGIDIKKYGKEAEAICYDRWECKSLGMDYTKINNHQFYALVLALIKLEEMKN